MHDSNHKSDDSGIPLDGIMIEKNEVAVPVKKHLIPEASSTEELDARIATNTNCQIGCVETSTMGSMSLTEPTARLSFLYDIAGKEATGLVNTFTPISYKQ